LPDLQDDESVASLRAAIEKSLSWYARVPEDSTLSLGSMRVPAKAMRESLDHFASFADSGRIDPGSLSQDFDIFRVVPPDNSGRMFVTGYYEPVLDAGLQPGDKFAWPIYPVPSDLLLIELDRFDGNKFNGERLVGRLEKNLVVPYYTRSEIDGKRVLEKTGAQRTAPLAWLSDPVDCFFLHVQGAGVIRLPDGRQKRVGYAGGNGRPYRSIGKDLIESGAVSREQMSLQAIGRYLRSHPERRDEIMWKNESYVFFKWVSEGPVGSLGSVLTARRSIATDARYHPRGALAFLVSEKPVYDSSGEICRWERFGRWVLNQDTGGAIKGPGRIDLFCGTGEDAEKIAGPMKQQGELYYFIKKGLVREEP
jgi:membrane-bound lytic murein transglycosylase A